jgi:hypothetical protein
VRVAVETGEYVSAGTAINSNTILTHNHYDKANPPLSAGDLITENRPVAYADPVGPDLEGKPQTQLFTFDEQLFTEPALIASQNTIYSLDIGTVLQVVYWDENKREFSILSTTVEKPADNGRITLNNPNNIINPGDSGGGVYYGNMLIGNTWSINTSGPAQFTVAVLPPTVSNSSTATTPVRRREFVPQ